MKYTLKRDIEKPLLYSKNNIITKVNNEFMNLTGYYEKDVIGKSLKSMSNMLRIDSQVYLENIENEYSCFMFTKKYEPREVTIFCKNLKCEDEKVYLIKERANSRVEEKLSYALSLLSENEKGIAIYSIPQDIILKSNERFLDYIDGQYSENRNVIGRKIKEIFNEYSGSDLEKIFLDVINTGIPYYSKKSKYKYIEKSGKCWEVSVVPIYIYEKAQYIVYTAYDITEKIVNKKIVEEQKGELEAIIENMHDALVIFDKKGNIKKVNKSGRNYIFNFKGIKNINEYFKQAKIFDMNGNLILKENSVVSRILRGEVVSQYQVAIKVNNKFNYIELNGNPIYDKEGNVISGILFFSDVTDKLKYRQNLLIKTQLDLLNRIIEKIDIGFVRCSYPDFKIIDINNKSHSELKQINQNVGPLSSIKGCNFFDVFNIKEKIHRNEIIHRLLHEKSGSYFNCKRFIMAGEEKFLKVIYQPVFGLNKQIVEVVIVSMDVTEEVKAKNKMEQTLKMQEEFFVSVSHELKTPLNVIFSANQLMEFYFKNNLIEVNNTKIYNGIAIIKQNCYRFIKLINNIVDLSKIESGFLKLNLSNENIVYITEEIVQSVSEYIKEKQLSIIFDTNIEEKIIACDAGKIERIILNLISNSIKFTNPGGSIFVELIDKGDTVEILVKDTGIGIEERYINNIFGRFQQIDKSLSRNAEGSGIGLSLVKSIAEMHGGKISVSSKVDEGSIFKIELPVRTVESLKVINQTNPKENRVQMINIEFSDIYSKN